MGTMYRLKAYFGMVPAEELTEYVDEPEDRYPVPRRSRDGDDRWPERRRADQHRLDQHRVEPRRDDQRWTGTGWDERGREAPTWDDGAYDGAYDGDRYAGDDHGSSEPSRSGGQGHERAGTEALGYAGGGEGEVVVGADALARQHLAGDVHGSTGLVGHAAPDGPASPPSRRRGHSGPS